MGLLSLSLSLSLSLFFFFHPNWESGQKSQGPGDNLDFFSCSTCHLKGSIVFGVRVVVSKRCNSRGVMGGKDGGYSKCDLCFWGDECSDSFIHSFIIIYSFSQSFTQQGYEGATMFPKQCACLIISHRCYSCSQSNGLQRRQASGQRQ